MGTCSDVEKSNMFFISASARHFHTRMASDRGGKKNKFLEKKGPLKKILLTIEPIYGSNVKLLGS